MHVFILILTIAGQPERIAAICPTYKACSDAGAQVQAEYLKQFHKQPSDFSYRVEPGTAVMLGKETQT